MAELQALAPWCSLQMDSGHYFPGALESQGLNVMYISRVCFQASSRWTAWLQVLWYLGSLSFWAFPKHPLVSDPDRSEDNIEA